MVINHSPLGIFSIDSGLKRMSAEFDVILH